MSKRMDVCAPRKKKDGGTWWHRVGTAFENDKGITLYFDSLPLPDNEGRVAVMLFEAKDRQQSPQQVAQAAQAPLSDEIPFAPERR